MRPSEPRKALAARTSSGEQRPKVRREGMPTAGNASAQANTLESITIFINIFENLKKAARSTAPEGAFRCN